MKPFSTLFFVIFCAASSFAQTNKVVFSFDHKVGTEPLLISETIFPIWNGKKVKLNRAEFYISEAEIHHADGTTMSLTDQYLLVNANNPTAEFDLGEWPVEAADGVTLHLGVPAAVNHLDPASYPSDSPLSPQNPSMQWGWSAGYRFLAVEGKIDNNNDGVPETAFEWHCLGDALYKTLELTTITNAENGTLHLHFVVDYTQLFKNMAMTGSLIQHGSGTQNIKMMDNAEKEHYITMPEVLSTDAILINSEKISVSPNPFSTDTRIVFELPATSNCTMILTNSLGQIVRTMPNLSAIGSILLEKSTLPNGIYQAVFYENDQILARKQLMIQE